MNKTILLTGGAGFIGSALVRYLINETNNTVVNVDKLTYAGNLESLESIAQSERYSFEQVDICDAVAIKRVFEQHQPDIIMHLAAQSHVKVSFEMPEYAADVVGIGMLRILEAVRILGLTQKTILKLYFIKPICVKM